LPELNDSYRSQPLVQAGSIKDRRSIHLAPGCLLWLPSAQDSANTAISGRCENRADRQAALHRGSNLPSAGQSRTPEADSDCVFYGMEAIGVACVIRHRRTRRAAL